MFAGESASFTLGRFAFPNLRISLLALQSQSHWHTFIMPKHASSPCIQVFRVPCGIVSSTAPATPLYTGFFSGDLSPAVVQFMKNNRVGTRSLGMVGFMKKNCMGKQTAWLVAFLAMVGTSRGLWQDSTHHTWSPECGWSRCGWNA